MSISTTSVSIPYGKGKDKSIIFEFKSEEDVSIPYGKGKDINTIPVGDMEY